MKISSNKQIPKIFYDLVWCLSSYFMAHLTQHTSIFVLYHTNFPHIKYQPWTFPSLSVVLIAMTNSSSARHHLIRKVHVITVYSMVSNVFFLWQRWWRHQQRSPPVLMFIHSSAIVFIAPKATENASPATIASHNAHDAPSGGFPYYINYRHKDDVMI
jgi:hypothetical protein